MSKNPDHSFMSLVIEDFIKTRILILLSPGKQTIPLIPCGGESTGVGYNGVRAIESEASFFSSLFPFHFLVLSLLKVMKTF